MSFSNNILWSPCEYDEACVLAREVGEVMLSRLDWVTIKPKLIVDMGCGTGEISAKLKQRYQDAQLISLDSAERMLAHGRERKQIAFGVCAEADTLPLADQSVDMIFANFLVPWCADFKTLFTEWRRVLRPDGLLMFNAFGPDTLRELRGICDAAHVPWLIDMHDVGDMLLQAGFSDPVLDVDHYSMTYRALPTLVRDLSANGMLSLSADTENSFQDWQATSAGLFVLGYEIIIAHAFAPSMSDAKSISTDGTVRVPLAELRKKLAER